MYWGLWGAKGSLTSRDSKSSLGMCSAFCSWSKRSEMINLQKGQVHFGSQMLVYAKLVLLLGSVLKWPTTGHISIFGENILELSENKALTKLYFSSDQGRKIALGKYSEDKKKIRIIHNHTTPKYYIQHISFQSLLSTKESFKTRGRIQLFV